jgi:hypothetical protein
MLPSSANRNTFPASVLGSCGVAPVVVTYNVSSRPKARRMADASPSPVTKMSFATSLPRLTAPERRRQGCFAPRDFV